MANSKTPKIVLQSLSVLLRRRYVLHHENFRSASSRGTDDNDPYKGQDPVSAPEDPDEPTTCCMSGCANCVWLRYAEVMAARYKDGGVKARKAIENIKDPMMKAFLMMELKTLEK